ncbi:uncharacterized protein Myc isoform X2 [Anoplolepis gracilipes]
MIKEDVEAIREKDWKERRKFHAVDEIIGKLENRFFLQNEDICDRCDSLIFCWNNCRSLRVYNKTYQELLTAGEMCCPEYPLHKIFVRKESINRMLNCPRMVTASIPLYNSCIKEEPVRSKPTVLKQNAQPAKNQPISQRRSVLKSHAGLVNSAISSAANSQTNPLTNLQINTPSNIMKSCQESRIIKNLESDGDSPRSASPQSSTDEDDIFQNDQITEKKLFDYISEGAASAGRDTPTKSSSQKNRRRNTRRDEDESQPEAESEGENIKRNAHSDHCYHQSRSMERFRRETFSETDEEEIDVVSYEKKTTYFNYAQNQRQANQRALSFTPRQHNANQLALNFSSNQQNANQLALNFAQPQHNANQLVTNVDKAPMRRPRGRPPGSNSAKRKAAAQMSSNETSYPPAKRARVQTYQRGQKRQKCARQWRPQDDDDDEEDKRNLHNNMERQRRISMKNFFDVLKQHVPAIATKERVAKVTILRQAKTYINALEDDNSDSLLEIKKMERQHQFLRKRFEELQREQSRMLRLQRRY